MSAGFTVTVGLGLHPINN